MYIKYLFSPLLAVKARKAIRIAGLALIILLLLGIIILGAGGLVLNRYLNNNGKATVNQLLPINGILSYDKVSIHPFRDFPNISLKLKGLQIADSLAMEHKQPPLKLESLFLNASVTSFRKKHLNIKSVELVTLTLNMYDRADGYSNMATLIRKKIENRTSDQNKDGWTIDYNNTDLNIREIQLNKIDEDKNQKAHLFIDEVEVKNKEVDSAYHLTLNIEKSVVSNIPEKSLAQPPIQLNRAMAEVRLEKSFSSATLVSVQLSKGQIDLRTDSMGISNFSGLLGSKSKSKAKEDNGKGIAVDVDGADVTISDIEFAMVDQPGNKHLAARIVNLSTQIDVTPDTSALIDLHLDIDQLAFNTTKGAFLTNSIAKGQIKTNYDNGLIELSCPDLTINEGTFNVQADLYLDKRSPTTLTIEKPEAQTEKIRPLLTEKIQRSILPYDVLGPLYAKAHVVFTPGEKKPRVNVDLSVQNKTVIAKGQVIKNADVTATFINGLYDDFRQHKEDPKNMRLFLHKVSGEFNDFQVDTKNALITSTPEQGARLIAKADVTGNAASISQFLKHDNFSFQDGAFSLTTDINGSLNNLDDLIAGTNLNLVMNDMQVFYPAGNTTLPLRILEVKKESEKTIFEIEGLSVDNGSPIRIRGEVDRIESMLFPGQRGQMQTEANIRASSISWEGLIALFGRDGIISAEKNDSTRQAKRSMKQTLSGIQKSFHPAVKVRIDTVHYGQDVQLLDFHTGLSFDDDRTLILEETSFKIDKSNVTLDGEVIINQLDFTRFDFDIELQNLDFDALMPKFDYFGIHLIKQIHDQPDNLTMHVELSGELDDNAGLRPESIDAYITYESFAEDKFSGSVTLKANPSTKKVDVIFGHSGHPRNFNHILESDAYRFDKGWYTISFEFDNNFESIAQMVEESKFGLTIVDAEVLITELGVTVPLSRIELASINNKSYYYLLLKSDSLDQELALDGIVENIRHFAFKDTEESFEVELNISSPRIVWDDLKQIMAYGNNGSQQSGKIIKESLTKILQDFNPNVKLKVDKLEYSDQLAFNNIFAHAYLENNILKIDSANVAFGDSHIEANVNMDMSHKAFLPFNLNLGLSNIDIAQTLNHFDYFNLDELRSAKKIDGNIWFDLEMAAEIDLDNSGFVPAKTDAEIMVDLRDLIIEDLHTINTIAEKIGKGKRFSVLRFAPIESNIKVLGSRIEIEETEIQSNAIQAFVEGTIDKDSPENLWISIPVKNLKKPNLESIPDKTGYAATGRKIFFQWVSSQSEEDGKMKVRLSRKQFFKERFQVRQFRDFKKEIRKERRKMKQKARTNTD